MRNDEGGRPSASPQDEQTDLPDRGRGRPPQPVLIGIGGLALIAAILAAAVLLRPGDPGTAADPSASASAQPSRSPSEAPTAEPTTEPPSPAPTQQPTPTQEPTPTPLPSGAAPLRWTAGTPPDGYVYAIRWIADRWLAAGSADGRAAVWSSTDGLSWTAAPAIPPEPVDGPEGTGYWITDLIEYGDAIVAVGWNRIGCCDGGKPIAWRSGDGSTWEMLATDGTGFEPHHFPSKLAVAPDGTLVLASHTGLGSAWITLTTRDLRTWERHEVTRPDSFSSLSDLAASPSTLVAVGTDVVPDTDPEHFQQVWTSTDGSTWRLVAAPVTNGQLWGVAWDEARSQFLAVGQDAEDRPAVWRSTDGTAWSGGTRLDDGPGLAGSIDAMGGLIVATGTLGESGSEIGAWSSFDGITWQIADLGAGYSGQVAIGARPGGATIYLRGLTGAPEYRDVIKVWAGAP